MEANKEQSGLTKSQDEPLWGQDLPKLKLPEAPFKLSIYVKPPRYGKGWKDEDATEEELNTREWIISNNYWNQEEIQKQQELEMKKAEEQFLKEEMEN